MNKSMKGMNKKKLLACGAGVLALILVLVSIISGIRGKKVETAVAAVSAVEDIYTEEGTLHFGGEYRVISQVSGPLGQIFVEENSQVKKGDVLYVIDSTDYEYDRAMAQASLDGYKAQLDSSRINQVMTTSPQEYLDGIRQQMAAREADYRSAKTVYEGNQVLYASGAVSKVQMEESGAAYESALSAWQQAQGRYEESRQFLESLKEKGIEQESINSRFYGSGEEQINASMKTQETTIQQLDDKISKCQVKAEKDGIITALPVKEMSVIQEGETAAVISSREQVEAEADVLTNIAPYIKAGDKVEVVLQLRGKDQTYMGTVSQVYDYASKGTSSLGLDEYRVHVTAVIDGMGDAETRGADVPDAETPDIKDLESKDGYGVNMTFTLYQKQDCLVVPSSSVFKADRQSYVFQIKGGRAVKVPVDTEYQSGVRTVIASGLEEGDVVIDRVDAEGIYDGARVHG